MAVLSSRGLFAWLSSATREFLAAAAAEVRQLTYPNPGAMLRMTAAVLLSSVVLTLAVQGLDAAFAALLQRGLLLQLLGLK
jgi:preprotein translocase subunit SecE